MAAENKLPARFPNVTVMTGLENAPIERISLTDEPIDGKTPPRDGSFCHSHREDLYIIFKGLSEITGISHTIILLVNSSSPNMTILETLSGPVVSDLTIANLQDESSGKDKSTKDFD